jgi:putative exporter of polyketide antibiotics
MNISSVFIYIAAFFFVLSVVFFFYDRLRDFYEFIVGVRSIARDGYTDSNGRLIIGLNKNNVMRQLWAVGFMVLFIVFVLIGSAVKKVEGKVKGKEKEDQEDEN